MARPGQPAELARIAKGLLIGAAPGTRREVTTVPIPAGALLCFFTDGLVERPGQLIDDGLDRLRRAVAAEPPEAACAAVMGALVGSEPSRDDVTLLMIRFGAFPPVPEEADTDT
jgi:serine phosphatase RsbU (regulator of sigma subunit)